MMLAIDLWIVLVGLALGCGALAAAWRAAPPGSRPRIVVEAAPSAPPAPLAPSGPARLRAALSKTRLVLAARIEEAFGRASSRDGALEDLEEALVSADVGIRATQRILDRVRATAAKTGFEVSALRTGLAQALEEILGSSEEPAREGQSPWVILVAGVNGVGKTTSIGKLASRLRTQGKSVLLVAGDTFRAAAIDQLGLWGERVGVEVIKHQSGSDPAAVAFDGVKAARARGVDVVVIDTAGRLHTRQNLMDELKKVARVIGREIPGAPHEVLLVVDATTGQNAVTQARVFGEAIGITGVILTKLDGTAKGGAALAVREELGVPIRYIGVGEGVDDLRPFDAREFVSGLLSDEGPAAA